MAGGLVLETGIPYGKFIRSRGSAVTVVVSAQPVESVTITVKIPADKLCAEAVVSLLLHKFYAQSTRDGNAVAKHNRCPTRFTTPG